MSKLEVFEKVNLPTRTTALGVKIVIFSDLTFECFPSALVLPGTIVGQRASWVGLQMVRSTLCEIQP